MKKNDSFDEALHGRARQEAWGGNGRWQATHQGKYFFFIPGDSDSRKLKWVKKQKKTNKIDELSSLSSFPVLDVLSGWLLSNFYLSYYTFMFFIGIFLQFGTVTWISIRNRDTNLNFWPDSLFLLLIQKEPNGLQEKEKRLRQMCRTAQKTYWEFYF